MCRYQTTPRENGRGRPEDFWPAVRDSVPVMLGITPFGITCGIMGISAGLTPPEIILMSLLVFAGSAQFISISLLASGITGWGIIVLTTLLVNLRHLLMGASLAPYLARFSLPLQALVSFGLTDESYALTISRIDRAGYSVPYHLGVNTAQYVSWALSTAAGALLGSRISDPLAWGLDFAMPLTFIVLLAPRLTDRSGLVVCGLAAMIVVTGALYLPGKWYLLAASLGASLVGGIMEGGNQDAP
jgi:4-azaleucine resistance transporter AzlC